MAVYSPLSITLETVTPLWTGGADGKSDPLHLTGIMGSLRWWYEVLVRSVDGKVCNPTSQTEDERCRYDPDTDSGLCDVCRVFGATGWSRRFRIIISDDGLHTHQPKASRITPKGLLEFGLSNHHPYRSTSNPKWYLNGLPLRDRITLTIIPTGPIQKDSNVLFDPAIIGALIQFIADYASLGAKPQMGLGVVQVISHQQNELSSTERIDIAPLIKHLKHIIVERQEKHDLKQPDERFPCLQNMFFARVKTKVAVTRNLESVTFDIKHGLRDMLYGYHKSIMRDLMGYAPQQGGKVGRKRGEEEKRIGSKIMISYPDENGTVRMWGWVPDPTQYGLLRNEVLQKLKSNLLGKFSTLALAKDAIALDYIQNLEQTFQSGAEQDA